MKQVLLTLVTVLALGQSGWCDMVMSFDPDDLTVTSTGGDQTIDLGILIAWDGIGENTLSGFTLNFSESSPSLEIIPGGGFNSDFTWSFNSGVNTGSISGSNDTDHVIDTTGTQLLGTLSFTLDGSFTEGTIPIDLSFVNAQRDVFTPIPASEVTVTGGTLNVAAVPEPGSLALLGLAFGSLGLYHGRRRRNSARGADGGIHEADISR